MSSDAHVARDAVRRRQNEASREWATREGITWTDDECVVLLEKWVLVDPRDRDEVKVSKTLNRTIQACRTRAEKLREELGVRGACFSKTKEKEPEICTSCWQTKAANGSCAC